MQVSKIQSPSFQAIHVQSSKMTNIQKRLAANLTDTISYTDSYVNADALGIDICIFPQLKNARSITAKFLDTNSGNFVKNAKRQHVKFSPTANDLVDYENSSTAVHQKGLDNIADKFLEKLDQIVCGKYKFDKFDPIKFNEGNTDMHKLFSKLNKTEVDGYEILYM